MNFSFVSLIEFEPPQNSSMHKYLLVMNTIARPCMQWVEKKTWGLVLTFSFINVVLGLLLLVGRRKCNSHILVLS